MRDLHDLGFGQVSHIDRGIVVEEARFQSGDGGPRQARHGVDVDISRSILDGIGELILLQPS